MRQHRGVRKNLFSDSQSNALGKGRTRPVFVASYRKASCMIEVLIIGPDPSGDYAWHVARIPPDDPMNGETIAEGNARNFELAVTNASGIARRLVETNDPGERT